ncbi:MAG TPA: crossover junction endodeoxyribonuclease RuvC [Chitinophagaceae bacterium]|nr:crossover junction endodeoxyribonuclease RuvC [Chitinophagaceae bacterium]
MPSEKSNIILGIDPGTIVMGFGIIRHDGKVLQLLEMGTLRLKSTPNSYEKLQHIHEKVAALIRLHHPGCFAIEAPFFGKNVQSMLKLGRAQGVAIAAAMQAGLPVREYAPKKVKMAVTGNGNASKEQIWQMLERILHFQDKPRSFDATDAVAVAVCHHFQQRSVPAGAGGGLKDWKTFIDQHPEKVFKQPSP